MAISTFAELQVAIASWLHRSDLSANIPEFITLAESRIYNGCKDPQYPSKPLRVRNMQNRDSGTVGALGAVAIPSQYVDTIRFNLTVNGLNRPLRYLASVDNSLFETKQGKGLYYTIVNNSFFVGPYDGSSYTHDYYKSFDPLATTATNWLLTNAPGVYLYGALIEAAPFINKDSRLTTWYRMFSASINSLTSNDRGAPLGQAMQVTVG